MKKLLPAIAFFLILFLLPVPSAAAGEDITDAIRTAEGLSPLEEALYLGMMATKERIDIEAFGASTDDVKAAMQHLSDSVPELFHVSRSYLCSTKAVTPTYSLTGEALRLARAEYLFALDMIAAAVDPDWSDAEICLFLHDYLCTFFAYDTDYEIYDAYAFLTEGRGVCQAYTLTYTALLSRFGIRSSYATGADGDLPHIWNVVELDGEYYHVDVTWGDALTGGKDCFGRATHDNFLKSDAAIDAAGHTGRKNRGGIVCDDTRYDEGALSDAESAAVILDGVVYAVADGVVYAFENGLDGAPRTVHTVSEEWRTGTQILASRPAGLAAYGGTLYVNTPKSILALDTVSGYTEPLLTVESGLVMTICNKDEVLYYSVADDIYGKNQRILQQVLPSALPPCTGAHSYTVYATAAASCREAGTVYKKCTACGHKATEAIPLLPHTVSVSVVPPDYTAGGYTLHTCTVCGHTDTTDPTDPLPTPTLADYRAAVTAALQASDAEARIAAMRTALAMEPHIGGIAVTDEYRALREAMAAHESAAAAANEAHAEGAALLLFADFSFFTGAGTAMLLLFLVIRRIFGL